MSNSVRFETTLHVRNTCLCLHAQRAARVLARHLDVALRPVGLTNQQFSLLLVLNRPAPPPMRRVARLLAVDNSTLTAAVKPLERRGFVRIEPSPADHRARLLALTKAGAEALATAVPLWQMTQAATEGQLDGLDPDALRAALNVVASIQ